MIKDEVVSGEKGVMIRSSSRAVVMRRKRDGLCVYELDHEIGYLVGEVLVVL